MNIFHGSPGSNITNASARAFATKGIIPEFRDCKWNYEEDPKGLPEFAHNFKTVLEARFPEAVVLRRGGPVWENDGLRVTSQWTMAPRLMPRY